MNIDGSDFITLNDSIGSSSLGPLPSIAETPEGNKIVFSHNEDIYEFDLESTEIRNLTNTPDIRERDPYYSHNGDSISYRTIQDSILTISIMNYNGENKNIVIEYNIPQGTALYLYCPCFSKNDKKIYYILYSFGDEIKYGLYSININGLNNQCIYDGSIANYFLSMHSNANKILFCGYDSLYIMKEDGSDLTNLGESDYYRPVISSDGSKILFVNHNRIYIMNIDGSERRQILDNRLNDYCRTVAFLPDDRVMCSVQRRVQ
jgi:Tol biopolymer transport system component